MTTYAPGDRDRRFADALDALARGPDARRAIAILRRSAGSPRARFDAYRVLDRVVPPGAGERELEAYELVAGLYAVYHQGRISSGAIEGDLGASFAQLAGRPGWDADRAGRRLAVLLSADAAPLPERLRHAVALLRSAQVPIDWGRLANDVRFWSHPDQLVQRRWARAFVSRRTVTLVEDADPATDTTTSEGAPA
jgi:CRISPR system Cascade subunit CasB